MQMKMKIRIGHELSFRMKTIPVEIGWTKKGMAQTGKLQGVQRRGPNNKVWKWIDHDMARHQVRWNALGVPMFGQRGLSRILLYPRLGPTTWDDVSHCYI
jgi:hypothetical protein